MIDAKTEMMIVENMIMSAEFCENISTIWKDQLQLPSTQTVSRWCMEYFKKYNCPPKFHIQDIFKQHEKDLEKENSFLIKEFLIRLSKKYKKKKEKKINIPYILDICEDYLRTIALEETRDKLSAAIEKGALTRAENIVKKFERTVRPESNGVDPYSREAILNTFAKDEGDKLFRFPGTLGEVVGDFEREYLAAFFGVRGTGKTWWLLWVALLSSFHGCNVVFISLEMSEKQIIKRIYQYLTGSPTNKRPIHLPYFNDEDEGDEITTISKTVTRKELGAKIALEKIRDMRESSMIKGDFKLLSYPSGTKTVSDLKAHLHNLELYESFIPDVIVTDYADKFKAEEEGEMRHKIGSIWRAHKALAQERKCLVFTASQTNTARSGKTIGVGSAAESMEKENESDFIMALNQTNDQKTAGLMRACITKHRHAEWDTTKEVYITQSYDIGRPYLDSKRKS